MKHLFSLLFLGFFISSYAALADPKEGLNAVSSVVETGAEKVEAKGEKQLTRSTIGLPPDERGVAPDSTANSVKYNYLFYLLFKLKYGEIPPSELINEDF